MIDVVYSGRTLDDLRVLERGGQLLGLPFAAGDGLDLTRVVTWGEPERRLRYAARLLAVDLFTAEHAHDAEESLYQLLCSLPPEQDWQMRRSELLARAFYVRNVAVQIQGQVLTFPLLAMPEEGCYLRVLIDTPLGWLEVFAPEMDSVDHRENLTPEQEAGGEAYLSLTPFPVPCRVRGASLKSLGDLARLQAFGAQYGLVVQASPPRIMFMADKTPDFRAFMADAREALCLVRPGQPVSLERPFVPGEPVALADAVAFGQEARLELTELFLELRRTEGAAWPRPQRAAGPLDRTRCPLRPWPVAGESGGDLGTVPAERRAARSGEAGARLVPLRGARASDHRSQGVHRLGAGRLRYLADHAAVWRAGDRPGVAARAGDLPASRAGQPSGSAASIGRVAVDGPRFHFSAGADVADEQAEPSRRTLIPARRPGGASPVV